jgi:hypothetical protein
MLFMMEFITKHPPELELLGIEERMECNLSPNWLGEAAFARSFLFIILAILPVPVVVQGGYRYPGVLRLRKITST